MQEKEEDNTRNVDREREVMQKETERKNERKKLFLLNHFFPFDGELFH